MKQDLFIAPDSSYVLICEFSVIRSSHGTLRIGMVGCDGTGLQTQHSEGGDSEFEASLLYTVYSKSAGLHSETVSKTEIHF